MLQRCGGISLPEPPRRPGWSAVLAPCWQTFCTHTLLTHRSAEIDFITPDSHLLGKKVRRVRCLQHLNILSCWLEVRRRSHHSASFARARNASLKNGPCCTELPKFLPSQSPKPARCAGELVGAATSSLVSRLSQLHLKKACTPWRSTKKGPRKNTTRKDSSPTNYLEGKGERRRAQGSEEHRSACGLLSN